MNYDVNVTADIKQTLTNASALDAPSEVKKLLNAAAFTNQVKVFSEGKLRSTREGRIKLTFNSANGRENEISFARSEPGLVALRRGENEFQEAVTVFLEEGERRRCIAKGPTGERIEFTVFASRVENRLLRSGKMTLDYVIEVCGIRAEEMQMTLTVSHSEKN